MASKKDRFANLSQSVAKQSQAAVDRFARADITLAIAATSGETFPIQPNTSDAESPPISVGAHALEGRILKLLIDDVIDHPRNARKLYDEERLNKVGQSLIRDGQKVPAIVMKHPTLDGKYLLIEGRYRKKGLKSIGHTHINVVVIDPVDDREAYRLSRMLNKERSDQTDLDDALSWKEMLDDGIYTSHADIVEDTGLSEASISKILSMLALPHSVLAVMKTNPKNFGVSIAYELVQLAKGMPIEKLEKITEQINEGKLTRSELEAMREKRSKPNIKRGRSRAYPLVIGDASFGKMREFDDGRFNIDLKDVPESLRIKLKDAVQQIFEEEMQKVNAPD